MKLECIVPGSRLSGIARADAAEVVATRPYGPDTIEVVWRGPDGLGDRMAMTGPMSAADRDNLDSGSPA